jgi:hypothetical protein
MRRTSYAYTSNKNIDSRWVLLQNMSPKILFENFEAINHDGNIYGECINISDESNKQEEEWQDSEENVPPARVILIEANKEKKREGKGPDSSRSDNPRARKI